MKVLKTILFYLLSFTWGIIMTLFGIIVALGCLIIGKEPKHFHIFTRFEIGRNWGGFEAGPFFFTDDRPSLFTKQHEAGHGIQNVILGPLMPFVVSIPSATRYWLRECKTQKGKYIFAAIWTLVVVVIGLAFLIPGSIFIAIWAIVIGALIIAYAICIACWLFIKEIPQYVNNANVGYYTIWFERQASDLGQKYFPDDEKAED